MNTNQVMLRCEDRQEVVVFTKYTFHTTQTTDYNYELMFEDSYIGGDYKGFFGRIKRAWRAFWDKPVIYTAIYCEDKDEMRQFLSNCLDIINDTAISTENVSCCEEIVEKICEEIREEKANNDLEVNT